MRASRKISCVATSPPQLFVHSRNALHSERRNFVGDAGLFHRLTGWRAQVGLESGIRDYFKEALAGAPHGAA